jgi:hypothetical protein
MVWTIRWLQTFIRFVQWVEGVSGAVDGEWKRPFAGKSASTCWTCEPQCRRLRVSDGNSPNCLR